MSRQRSKNKRKRDDEYAETTASLYRKIYRTGEVTQDDANYIYMIWKPNCDGCRTSSKDNPNCFCALAPSPGGTRRTGLWQRLGDAVLGHCGDDPTVDLRDSLDVPAGLRNLGATCYLNSILQCLYMNQYFREGIFSVEPELLKQHKELDQLARLFARLQASCMAYVDAAPFIESLKIDDAVQQDSHEFLTLLLPMLERSLGNSKDLKTRTIIQDLFRGSVSHATMCTNCGNFSEASSNVDDFYDLELNIDNLKSLDESLDDYLRVEELRGENQYFCQSCGMHADASRSIKLQKLPAVLNIQLKRCVFSAMANSKRKKLTSPFCFPGELAMGPRMSGPSQSEQMYDLSAVLLHKGTATSGHYFVIIKDPRTSQWWKFNDADVSNLGPHPFGEGSISSAKSVGKETSKQIYSSCDAYMLMYNLKHTAAGGEKLQSSPSNEISVPSLLLQEVDDLNKEYLTHCKNYKSEEERLLKHVTDRQEEVRSILPQAPVLSAEELFFWISTDWLRQWADSIDVPPIENSSIQCMHGKVPESKLGSMKRLSAKAWNLLASKYAGGPRLASDDYCSSCLINKAEAIVSADDYRARRASMKEVAEAVLAGHCLDGQHYYVSKSWLQHWVRRKNVDAPFEADIGPTASIVCPHAKLLPDEASGAERLLVPESLWLFFYESASAMKPECSLSISTFPAETEPCTLCSADFIEAACKEDTLRKFKHKQREIHQNLASGRTVELFPNCKYYLLPCSWLSTWRSYIKSIGKNSSSSVVPETLDNAINSVKCDKHSRLLEHPPKLRYEHGMISTTVSLSERIAMITDNDWKLFCEDWGGTVDKGIRANIVFDQDDWPIIQSYPEVCVECLRDKESHNLMCKRSYSDETIFICPVHGEVPPASLLEASSAAADPDRRKSKRLKNTLSVTVSGCTTLHQLKMMIAGSSGGNLKLHKGGIVIDEVAATLGELNIFPGDVLWFFDKDLPKHHDITDELLEQVGVQQAGEGFHGSLLTSAVV